MYKSTIFLSFLSFLLFVQCKQNQNKNAAPVAQKKVIFKGTIENATQKTINIATPYERMEVPVKEGQFSVEMPLEGAVLADFFYGKKNWKAFAKSGETIAFSFKEKNFDDTFKVSKYGDANKFATDLMKDVLSPQDNFEGFYGQEEASFIKNLDALSLNGISKVMKFVKAHPETDPEYVKWLNHIVIYANGEFLEMYPNVYGMINIDKTYKKSATYKEVQARLNKERPELLGHPSYERFLRVKLNNAAADNWDALSEEEKETADYLPYLLKGIESIFKNSTIKEYLAYSSTGDQLRYKGVTNFKPYLDNFLSTYSTPFYKEKLTAEFQKWEHLQVGKTAPDFTYPDLKNQLHTLNDYKGKYVYIDVWATWCGPCIAEQPTLASLEKAYHSNKDLVFMSVSIDTDKVAWEKMVKDRGLAGVQLYAKEAGQAKICNDYNIAGIPRFILVGRDGKLIDSNAPRPSSKALENRLADLLKVEPVEGD